MSLSLGITGPKAQQAPEMRAARNRVFAATKAHKIFFLEGMAPDNIIAKIKEGVRVGRRVRRLLRSAASSQAADAW